MPRLRDRSRSIITAAAKVAVRLAANTAARRDRSRPVDPQVQQRADLGLYVVGVDRAGEGAGGGRRLVGSAL